MTFRSVAFDNLYAADEPLIIHARYTVQNAFRRSGRRLVGEWPAPWERAVLADDYVEDRRTPFRIHFPLVVDVTNTLELPESIRPPRDLETELSGRGPTGHWRAARQVTGSRLEMHSRHERVAGRFDPDQYQRRYQLTENWLEAVSPLLIFEHVRR